MLSQKHRNLKPQKIIKRGIKDKENEIFKYKDNENLIFKDNDNKNIN